VEAYPSVYPFRYALPMSANLAGIAELCDLFGVSKRTARKYADRPDFPQPVAALAAGRVWKRRDVEAWGRSHLSADGRLPTGRPKKSAGRR
jgi:prophage regulatory protein